MPGWNSLGMLIQVGVGALTDIFIRKEIEAMFDKQIHQIIIEIDKTLEHLQQMQPGLKVVGVLIPSLIVSSLAKWC